eukprot:4832208-Pyramimonas_sp.AAC.2
MAERDLLSFYVTDLTADNESVVAFVITASSRGRAEPAAARGNPRGDPRGHKPIPAELPTRVLTHRTPYPFKTIFDCFMI